MSENFFLILIAMIFSFVLGILFIWWVGLGKASAEFVQESQKLQLKINQAKSTFKEYSDSPQTMLGDIGIDGVLDGLGIPSVFKPIAKGFIDKIAQNPEILTGLLSKAGINLDVAQNQNKIVGQV